jgi:undecaprenyl-diphosphatase
VQRSAPARRLAPATARRRLEAIGILALLNLAALSTFHAVTTDRFAYDLEIARWFQKADLSSLQGVLFKMGVRGAAGALMAIACTWLWLRGNRAEAVMLALLALPDVSSFILRDLYDRPRPPSDLVTVYGGPQGQSFPSGTALHWTFFCGFVAYLLPKITRDKRVIYGLGALLALWPLVMGAWVINHGRHWPSDVLGGYLYGLLYLVLWIKLYPIARAWHARNPEALTTATLRRPAIALGLLRSQ